MKAIKKKKRLLLPSLRERKRYLAFEITSESQIDDFETVSSEIDKNLLSFMGEIGTASSGITLIKDCWDKKKQRGILMMSDTHVRAAQSTLALIEHIKSNPVMIRSLGASGILRKIKERYIAV